MCEKNIYENNIFIVKMCKRCRIPVVVYKYDDLPPEEYTIPADLVARALFNVISLEVTHSVDGHFCWHIKEA